MLWYCSKECEITFLLYDEYANFLWIKLINFSHFVFDSIFSIGVSISSRKVIYKPEF